MNTAHRTLLSFVDIDGIPLATAHIVTKCSLAAIAIIISYNICRYARVLERRLCIMVVNNKISFLKKLKENKHDHPPGNFALAFKNNSELIRNKSLGQIRLEHKLLRIHINESMKRKSKKLNLYFFEIINESLICITDVAENDANANDFEISGTHIFLERVHDFFSKSIQDLNSRRCGYVQEQVVLLTPALELAISSTKEYGFEVTSKKLMDLLITFSSVHTL